MPTTRTEVTLSCGCTRRMPRGTAMQRLTDQKPVVCPSGHDDSPVKSVPGPASVASLLRF